MTADYSTVTELPGEDVTQEQIERMARRYYWASEYCCDKDVLEVACGAGQGLGYLALVAKSLRAGDITPSLVVRAQARYGERIRIEEIDALQLPFPDGSLDVVILFEAIYYLPLAEQFVGECRRVLRRGGYVLLATANKDLFDFNPSPYSHHYYGVVELRELFGACGFTCEFLGDTSIDTISWRQKLLRPVKKIIVDLGLIPRSMAGKKLLKRLVFGKLVPMPAEIKENTAPRIPPVEIPSDRPDTSHKVIYLAARHSG